ncbi:hypothetical protein J5N97_016480 [Dioscorea zingiberensis]|uniref:KIB1-4 beta-propeller domain-containing protein n=1 Tax=Dioscorea zingiberensis TaxID=325984 RepID=A0A9D5CLV2_9LILI|nr:hypothetical protein J5N97_016480 [Dioscorea zingiberensis]
MIADHLNAIDHANFRSVCSSWRASSYKRPTIPLIIMGNYNKRGIQTICFFDTDINHIINLSKFTIEFGSYFCGSSHGWLAFFSQPFLRICLQNPITGARFMLPKTYVYCDAGFDEPFPIKVMLYPIEVRKFGLLNSLPAKVVLSGPATDPHCIIAIIWRHCQRVDFCKVKDEAWKTIEYYGRLVFQDLLFYKGHLYLSYKANIFHLDMEANKGEGEIVLVARAGPMEFGRIKMSFLVEFCGDLLLILCFNIGDCKYKLWKVNLEKNNRLELLQDQGERVVFLGHSGAVGMPPMSLLGSRPDSFFGRELFNMFQSDCNVFDVYDHYGDMNLKLKEYEVDINIWEPISWFQPCLQYS